jgi:phosphoribosyl 1,2-cyclic phosphate phosphodiesterase
LKITFLGTGTSQGVPVIACECTVCHSPHLEDKRLRCAVWLEVLGKSLVIDTGPDFRQQMLTHNVRHLDAVLLTHRHKDHVAGLDDVRSYNFKSQAVMPLFADALTIEGLKREFEYIFDGTNYPGIPRIEIHEIDEEPFLACQVPVTPIPVLHHQMPVLGFRIGNFAYVTDANYIPPASIERLHGLEVLVLNALRRTPHISHFTLDEALAVVEQLQPKQAYFTHISHYLGLHHEVSQELPPNVYLAYDGLTIALEEPKKG